MKDDCRSVTGSNLRRVTIECAVNPSRPYSEFSIEKKQFFPIPPDSQWKISMVKELIEMRDNDDDIVWNKKEISDTLEYLCTS